MSAPVSSAIALVALLAAFADAASIVPRTKDITIMEIKGSTAVDATSTVASAIESSTLELIAKNFTNVANNTDAEDDDGFYDTMYQNTLSAMWYLGTFGGLVLFFFAVTCVEMFFGNPLLPGNENRQAGGYTSRNGAQRPRYVWDAPPAYHLFAPPSYDEIVKGADVFGCADKQPQQQQQQQQQQPPQQQQQQQQQQSKPQKKSLLQQCDEDGAGANNNNNKKLADVYVVPVHCAASCTTPVDVAAADVKLLESVMTRL